VEKLAVVQQKTASLPGMSNRKRTSPSSARRVVGRIRGSVAILRHIAECYGPRGLPDGSLVLLLLDEQCVLLAQVRLRPGQDDGESLTLLPAVELSSMLAAAARYLRDADPRGRRGRLLVLLSFVAAATTPAEDAALDVALAAAARTVGMRTADIVVSCPGGWHSLYGGTGGPENPRAISA
jgi:hypothetical protein